MRFRDSGVLGRPHDRLLGLSDLTPDSCSPGPGLLSIFQIVCALLRVVLHGNTREGRGDDVAVACDVVDLALQQLDGHPVAGDAAVGRPGASRCGSQGSGFSFVRNFHLPRGDVAQQLVGRGWMMDGASEKKKKKKDNDGGTEPPLQWLPD